MRHCESVWVTQVQSERQGSEMKTILVSIGVIVVAVLAAAVFAVAVFAPPEISVFRPSGPEKANELIRKVTVEGKDHSYPLYFVEFDDEGFYADPDQKDAVLEAISGSIAEEAAGTGSASRTEGTVVLLYVHGLNHNAREEDNNVSCFGELLDATAMMQARRGVNVVGVYVGWPGLVYDNSNLNAVVAYLGREAAADRIAERGDLQDLFTSISRARHKSGSKHTRFVIIGHSLGGRATYLALRPIMLHSIEGGSASLRERIADVAVFANPAFSAVEHRSLKRLMSEQAGDSSTIPRFIVLTSESDEVLRGAFQASQKAKSFFRGDYGLNDRLRWTAVGHHLGYVTHDLRLEGGSYSNPEGQGECPRLSADELEIVKGMSRAQSKTELYNFALINHYVDGEKTYHTKLQRVAGRAGGEAMVIQVDEKIIPNHNDIFTTPIVDFIVRVLNCGYYESYCRKTLSSLEEVKLLPEENRAGQGHPSS